MHRRAAFRGGGYDEYTKLMLHCDGTDGSQVFIDSSASAHAMTANGDAQVDTSQKKFGTGSFLSDGTGDYLETPYSTDFDFATGDFTLEVWLYWAGINGKNQAIISAGAASGTGWELVVNHGASDRPAFKVGGSYIVDGTSTFATNTWIHFAAVRSSGTLTLYRDGTAFGSAALAGNVNADSGVLKIGYFNEFAQSYFGRADEIRISKGIARWTSNFTPPIAPYK